jgi:DNA-binding GntR family transcriptional regulator
MGISERTVFTAIKELEERRYVIVKRREFGTIVRKTPTGPEILMRVAGGKGVFLGTQANLGGH